MFHIRHVKEDSEKVLTGKSWSHFVSAHDMGPQNERTRLRQSGIAAIWDCFGKHRLAMTSYLIRRNKQAYRNAGETIQIKYYSGLGNLDPGDSSG